MDALKVGGKIYTNLLGDRNTVVDAAGRAVALTDWLPSIPGLRVHPLQSRAMALEKVSEDVVVPQLRWPD